MASALSFRNALNKNLSIANNQFGKSNSPYGKQSLKGGNTSYKTRVADYDVLDGVNLPCREMELPMQDDAISFENDDDRAAKMFTDMELVKKRRAMMNLKEPKKKAPLPLSNSRNFSKRANNKAVVVDLDDDDNDEAVEVDPEDAENEDVGDGEMIEYENMTRRVGNSQYPVVKKGTSYLEVVQSLNTEKKLKNMMKTNAEQVKKDLEKRGVSVRTAKLVAKNIFAQTAAAKKSKIQEKRWKNNYQKNRSNGNNDEELQDYANDGQTEKVQTSVSSLDSEFTSSESEAEVVGDCSSDEQEIGTNYEPEDYAFQMTLIRNSERDDQDFAPFEDGSDYSESDVGSVFSSSSNSISLSGSPLENDDDDDDADEEEEENNDDNEALSISSESVKVASNKKKTTKRTQNSTLDDHVHRRKRRCIENEDSEKSEVSFISISDDESDTYYDDAGVFKQNIWKKNTSVELLSPTNESLVTVRIPKGVHVIMLNKQKGRSAVVSGAVTADAENGKILTKKPIKEPCRISQSNDGKNTTIHILGPVVRKVNGASARAVGNTPGEKPEESKQQNSSFSNTIDVQPLHKKDAQSKPTMDIDPHENNAFLQMSFENSQPFDKERFLLGTVNPSAAFSYFESSPAKVFLKKMCFNFPETTELPVPMKKSRSKPKPKVATPCSKNGKRNAAVAVDNDDGDHNDSGSDDNEDDCDHVDNDVEEKHHKNCNNTVEEKEDEEEELELWEDFDGVVRVKEFLETYEKSVFDIMNFIAEKNKNNGMNAPLDVFNTLPEVIQFTLAFACTAVSILEADPLQGVHSWHPQFIPLQHVILDEFWKTQLEPILDRVIYSIDPQTDRIYLPRNYESLATLNKTFYHKGLVRPGNEKILTSLKLSKCISSDQKKKCYFTGGYFAVAMYNLTIGYDDGELFQVDLQKNGIPDCMSLIFLHHFTALMKFKAQELINDCYQMLTSNSKNEHFFKTYWQDASAWDKVTLLLRSKFVKNLNEFYFQIQHAKRFLLYTYRPTTVASSIYQKIQ